MAATVVVVKGNERVRFGVAGWRRFNNDPTVGFCWVCRRLRDPTKEGKKEKDKRRGERESREC